MRSNAATMIVDAELAVPAGVVRLARFDIPEAGDDVYAADETDRLDFSLTPRLANARACYRDRWGSTRFERVGAAFVMPRGEPMRFRHDGGRQSSVLCDLDPAHWRSWTGQDFDWSGRRLEASLSVSSPEIQYLLRRVAQELRQPGLASEPLVELMVGQIAIELGRFCSAFNGSAPAGGLAAWRLRLIEERLAETGEAPTLEALAALCTLSVRQLTRGFRASRGCSIGAYIAQQRIEMAKRLLRQMRCVKSVAYAMGFASPSSFSFAFRRDVGVTPREFQSASREALAS